MDDTKTTVARNPYAPPKSPTLDIAAPPREPRPIEVSRAIKLLWAYLAVSFTSAIWFFLMNPMAPVFALALGAAFLAILAGEGWVIHRLSSGRSWARWLALAWSILEVVADWQTARQILSDPVDLVLSSLTLLLCWSAMYFLFFSPGRRWFRRAAPQP